MRGRLPVRERAMGMGQNAGARERAGADPGRCAGGGRGVRLALVAGASRCRSARRRRALHADGAGARARRSLAGAGAARGAGTRRSRLPVHRPGQTARGAGVCRRQRSRPRRRRACRTGGAFQGPRPGDGRAAAPGARADRPGEGGQRARDTRHRRPGRVRGAPARGARRCLVRQGRQERSAHRVSQRARRERGRRGRTARSEDRRPGCRPGGAGAGAGRSGGEVTAMRGRYQRMRTVTAGPVLLSALAALLMAGACSKDKAIDEPAKLTPLTRPSLLVKRVWSASVDDKKAVALRLGLGISMANNRVYAAGHRGDVVALDLASGRELWRAKTRAPLSGGTAASEQLVLVGASDGQLFAFDAMSGKARWQVRLNGEVLAAATIAAHLIAVRTVDGKLHALSPDDGHELWAQQQAVPRLSLRGTARPVIIGEVVLCGFDNGKLLAVNSSDGSVAWETQVTPPHGRTELERLVDIDSAVGVAGHDVYAVGFQGRVAMLALDTGQIWWSHEASSYRGLVFDDDMLYMADANGEVVALKARTGAEVWW